MFPTDQVQTLERLVDEIERVPGVSEHPLRNGREQGIGEDGRGGSGCNRREQGALGGLSMPHEGPTLQPPFQHNWIRLAFERRALPPWRLTVAIRGDPARTVEQREILVLLRDHR